jgi:cytochrome b pre-mRNA-processing protein 3
MILKRLFRHSPAPQRSCYEAIVAAARHPAFYAEWAVPDTLDGRFDMISLHAFLVLDRLKGTEQSFRQELVDELFADMDRSLREMGVGDLSVGKKVRKMAEVFYGRVAAYNLALEGPAGALEAALARNIFADSQDGPWPVLLAAHVRDQRTHLASQDAGAIAGGSVHFKEPTP